LIAYELPNVPEPKKVIEGKVELEGPCLGLTPAGS